MTTTSTFSGINEDAKTSSRVLRPPGGGSSNIFGDSAPAAAAAQPRASGGSNKPSDSGIFGSTGSDSASRSGAQRSARDGDDSFNRLFGDTASSPVPSQKGTSASQRVSTHANLFGDSPDTPRSKVTASETTHDHIFGDSSANAQGKGLRVDIQTKEGVPTTL